MCLSTSCSHSTCILPPLSSVTSWSTPYAQTYSVRLLTTPRLPLRTSCGSCGGEAGEGLNQNRSRRRRKTRKLRAGPPEKDLRKPEGRSMVRTSVTCRTLLCSGPRACFRRAAACAGFGCLFTPLSHLIWFLWSELAADIKAETKIQHTLRLFMVRSEDHCSNVLKPLPTFLHLNCTGQAWSAPGLPYVISCSDASEHGDRLQ